MTPPRRKLPIGIQTFAKIREANDNCVDKTPMAWRLTQESGYFFLSRPRRLGKSLFLDTLRDSTLRSCQRYARKATPKNTRPTACPLI